MHYQTAILSLQQFDLPRELTSVIIGRYITVSTIYRINERLRVVFGDKFHKFKEVMKDSGCFISGSFLVQCIIDEYWKDTDIDIYIPTIGNESEKYSTDTFIRNTLGIKGKKNHESKYESHENLIEWVKDYKGKSIHTLQTIGVNVGKTSENFKTYVDTFDFEICKNIYFYDGTDNLIIKNALNVLAKTTKFECSTGLDNSVLRCHKYRDRGITFSNIEKCEKLNIGLCNDLPTVYCRKYTTEAHKVDKLLPFGLTPMGKDYKKSYNHACSEHCIIKLINPNLGHCHFFDPREDGIRCIELQ